MFDTIINGLLRRKDVSEQDYRTNYASLCEYSIPVSDFSETGEMDDDKKDLLVFIEAFEAAHHTLPTFDLVRIKYEKKPDLLIWLDNLEQEKPLFGADYANVVGELAQSLENKKFSTILVDVAEIVSTGKDVGRGKARRSLRGSRDARIYLESEISKLKYKDASLVYDVTDYTASLKSSYEIRRDDKSAAVGILSGLERIDLPVYGLKPGEVCFVAASVSEGKSTFSLNWSHTATKIFGFNVLFVSLEMQIDQIMRIFSAIHSAHSKFAKQGYKPLKYDDIKKGLLSKEEGEFYLNVVLNDLQKDRNAGRFVVWQPENEVTISDIKVRAEKENAKYGLDLIVIDHMGLVVQPRGNRYNDYSEDLNQTVRDTKRLAMTFDRGRAIPILVPYQMNRKGKEYADTHNGTYIKSGLSYANEVEKSGDLILYLYLNDELKARREIFVGCLKNRDAEVFEKFSAYADFELRIFRDLHNRTFDPQDLLEDIDLG